MVDTTVRVDAQTMSQILLEGAQEILGADRLQDILREFVLVDSSPAYEDRLPLQQIQALLQMLEGVYGVQGGRGLVLRIGRAAFRYGLKQFGSQVGFLDTTYRLLPSPRRLGVGLRILGDVIGEGLGDEIMVTDAEQYWLWSARNCLICQDHISADPCCYLTVGLLQEFTNWAGGGRFYRVVETECRATGQTACVFRIEKQPLD